MPDEHNGGGTSRVDFPAFFAEHVAAGVLRGAARVGEIGRRLQTLGGRIGGSQGSQRIIALGSADREITSAINALDELREALKDARELVRDVAYR
jgi:hypothetical protein